MFGRTLIYKWIIFEPGVDYQRSYHWDAQLLGTSSFRGRKNMLLILCFVICFGGDLHTQIWVLPLINQASLSTILPAQRSGICMIMYDYVCICHFKCTRNHRSWMLRDLKPHLICQRPGLIPVLSDAFTEGALGKGVRGRQREKRQETLREVSRFGRNRGLGMAWAFEILAGSVLARMASLQCTHSVIDF